MATDDFTNYLSQLSAAAKQQELLLAQKRTAEIEHAQKLTFLKETERNAEEEILRMRIQASEAEHRGHVTLVNTPQSSPKSSFTTHGQGVKFEDFFRKWDETPIEHQERVKSLELVKVGMAKFLSESYETASETFDISDSIQWDSGVPKHLRAQHELSFPANRELARKLADLPDGLPLFGSIESKGDSFCFRYFGVLLEDGKLHCISSDAAKDFPIIYEILKTLIQIRPGTVKPEGTTELRIGERYGICEIPVIQKWYQGIMNKNPGSVVRDEDDFYGTTEYCPIDCVSWYDAREFITKLNEMWLESGLQTEFPRNYRFNLPSALQWEYACRAGSTGKLGLSLDYSEPNYDEVGWTFENSGNEVECIEQKEPNAFGLYDMHGNVWEWCRDGSESGRTVCGGSVFHGQECCNASYRGMLHPDSREKGFGFRLVLCNT